MSALTAFVVVIPEQGVPQALLTVPEGLEVHRTPDAVDVRRACLEIAADLNAQAAAQYAASKPATPAVSDVMREALAKRGEE